MRTRSQTRGGQTGSHTGAATRPASRNRISKSTNSKKSRRGRKKATTRSEPAESEVSNEPLPFEEAKEQALSRFRNYSLEDQRAIAEALEQQFECVYATKVIRRQLTKVNLPSLAPRITASEWRGSPDLSGPVTHTTSHNLALHRDFVYKVDLTGLAAIVESKSFRISYSHWYTMRKNDEQQSEMSCDIILRYGQFEGFLHAERSDDHGNLTSGFEHTEALDIRTVLEFLLYDLLGGRRDLWEAGNEKEGKKDVLLKYGRSWTMLVRAFLKAWIPKILLEEKIPLSDRSCESMSVEEVIIKKTHGEGSATREETERLEATLDSDNESELASEVTELEEGPEDEEMEDESENEEAEMNSADLVYMHLDMSQVNQPTTTLPGSPPAEMEDDAWETDSATSNLITSLVFS